MKRLLPFLIALMPLSAYCQYGMINRGSQIYTQKGSLLEVQGTFANQSSGSVKNDGIIEVQGNFENDSGSVFQINTDSTSKDRAVKFIGSGTQTISGYMNTPGTASFYNLVVDMTSSSGIVGMQANVSVDGSLVFGTTTITSTYNPSSYYTSNNQKGFVETYLDSAEYILNVDNGNVDAIAGYPAMKMNGAPTTGYVLSSGIRGSANGGLQRKISTVTDYDFPIGTVAHGFNAARLNFSSIPSGGGAVMGKFNDGTDNPDGAVGTIGLECVGCTSNNPSPDNTGYNRFFETNPCNSGSAQWLIIDNAAVTNHGYWSFGTSGSSSGYLYYIETFANSYTSQSTITDTWRTLRYGSSYGYDPSGPTTNWTEYIDSVSTVDDLLTYTSNTGTSCYTGSGTPGGTYSGFGQFELGKSQSNGALPVTMLYFTASPVNDSIVLAWATAEELNNNGFEIDRSTEGTNFSKIGWMPGHDNSTEEQIYSFTDNDVALNTMYYYRLRQVDNNGHSVQSTVVSAEVTGTTTSFTISDLMPNPATTSTRIVATSMSQDEISAKVYLYNMEGKLVLNQLYTLNSGQNNIVLDLMTLANGTYSVIVKAAGNSYTKMLVVNK